MLKDLDDKIKWLEDKERALIGQIKSMLADYNRLENEQV